MVSEWGMADDYARNYQAEDTFFVSYILIPKGAYVVRQAWRGDDGVGSAERWC